MLQYSLYNPHIKTASPPKAHYFPDDLTLSSVLILSSPLPNNPHFLSKLLFSFHDRTLHETSLFLFTYLGDPNLDNTNTPYMPNTPSSFSNYLVSAKTWDQSNRIILFFVSFLYTLLPQPPWLLPVMSPLSLNPDLRRHVTKTQLQPPPSTYNHLIPCSQVSIQSAPKITSPCKAAPIF